MMTLKNKVDIYTDGACKGNPGPGGWGALLVFSQDQQQTLYGGQEQTTNNRMELLAVIKALESLPCAHQIALYLDSEYVKKGITEWIHSWKRQGWKTSTKQAVKNADLWQCLDALVYQGPHDIQWHWVKGHAGHWGNEKADALANKGVQEIIDQLPP